MLFSWILIGQCLKNDKYWEQLALLNVLIFIRIKICYFYGHTKNWEERKIFMPRHLFFVTSILMGILLNWSIVQAEKPTVAVFDFDVGKSVAASFTVSIDGQSSNASFEISRQTNLLTNKLVTRLTSSREVRVVERKKMQMLMQESQLSESEMTDPANAIQMGKMLGADYMMFGSISILDPSIYVKNLPYNAGRTKVMSLVAGATIRLVNTESGQVEAAADLQAEQTTREINPERNLKDMPQKFQDQVFSDLADKLASNIVNTLVPVKVAMAKGDTVYLARAGLTKDVRCEIVDLGDPIPHPDDPSIILGYMEESIAIVRVTDGLKNMSKAQVEEWLSADQTIPKGSICRPIE